MALEKLWLDNTSHGKKCSYYFSDFGCMSASWFKWQVCGDGRIGGELWHWRNYGLTIPSMGRSDAEALKQGSEQWNLACETIREALDTHGYFLVEYDAVTKGMRSLFDLPVETKRRSSTSDGRSTTYRGGYSFLPIYEAFTVVNAHQIEKAEPFTELMWPEGNAEFCYALNAVSNNMSELTRLLFNMILDSHGLGQHQETLAERSFTPFTMNRYLAVGVPEGDGSAVGVHEHADPGYLTVLGQNEVGGLTVKNNGGDSAEVDPGQSYFVVLVGQALRALTNGRLHATFHEVSVRGLKDRFSFGSFMTPNLDQIVDALPGMVSDECPRQFRPFAYEELAESVKGGGDFLCELASI